MEAIRNAVCTLKRQNGDSDPDNVRVTFVIAQKDHNFRLAPCEERDSFKNNVPSGTIVEGMSYGKVDGTFDFLLTPQGGLKGTSKPMLYRVLLDENDSSPSPLTKDLLCEMIYQMAFQCKLSISS